MYHKSIDQAGHFDLRGMSASRQTEPVAVPHLHCSPLALEVIHNLIFLPADEKRRVLDLLHERADQVVVGPLHGADEAELPLPTLETPPVVIQHRAVGLTRTVEDRADNLLVIVDPSAVHDWQLFAVPHPGRT